MSKYGSGASIKTVQCLEMKEVQDILDRYNMTVDDKTVILDVLREANYQWSNANAFCCYLEDTLMGEMGEAQYYSFIGKSLPSMSDYIMKKVEETYYSPENEENK